MRGRAITDPGDMVAHTLPCDNMRRDGGNHVEMARVMFTWAYGAAQVRVTASSYHRIPTITVNPTITVYRITLFTV
jgi:hypothetical protein